MEFFDKYHSQCQRHYNRLISSPVSSPLPSIIEERLGLIRSRLEELSEIPDPADKRTYYQNLSFEHQKALTNLRKDRSITIKPADKGTCIVIQDTKQYLLEGLKELEDRSTYVELDADTSLDTARQANELIKDCHLNKKLLSVFEKNHYTTDIKDVRAQRLYWLRKVHKNPHQLRPIVSCCSGPTQKLSQLCNNLLKEYLGSVQSLVSSTGETVRIIESLKVPPDSRKALILATLDVKALYPSIPHEAGISMALQQAIPTDPPVPSDYPKKAMIKEMLKIILVGNTFQFAGRTFKQVRGIAMGTPVAPTWANLFMGKLETEALNAWGGTLPLIWLRFIDDILTLFPGTPEELNKLLTHLNSRMTTINFTMESSRNKINFLDITVFKGERFHSEGILDIRPFSKAIDPHTYLHYSSAHPRKNLKGVVKAEVIRTLRRSSSPAIYAQAISQLVAWFTNRNYPMRLIKEVLAEVKFEDRDNRLRPAPKQNLPPGTTILSVRQHPTITDGAIYEALRDDDLPFAPLVSRRRPPSSGDLLVRAKTPSMEAAQGYSLRERPHRD